MPRIAVLLPVRDGASTVRAAAVSILRQTFRDLALIVIDDGSCDETGAILHALVARDDRVRIARTPGAGIAAALNAGLALAEAPFIARMDADDIARPERLERQLAMLGADDSLGAVGTQVRLFPRARVRLGMQRYADWLNGLTSADSVARSLYVESPIVHPSALIRRQALDELGGWRHGFFPEDYDLWLRMAARGWSLANVPEVLLDWRESARRLTRTDARYDLSRHRALKAHFLKDGPLAGRNAVAIWGAGESGKAFSDALRKEGIATALFIEVDRKKIGNRVRDADVVGVQGLERARGLPLLVAVGIREARELIRGELDREGWTELRDYWCVA